MSERQLIAQGTISLIRPLPYGVMLSWHPIGLVLP